MFAVMTPQRAWNSAHSAMSSSETTRTAPMTMVMAPLATLLKRLWRSQPMTPISVLGGRISEWSWGVVMSAQRSWICTLRL